ncbi:MAG: hypothetical protein Ct9H300mP12_15830 [Acidimicrobiales bacterium]|nr:MAG: hypothetical protein Ct9H300mP12_15830 [Acidimicrobiales bacterium]
MHTGWRNARNLTKPGPVTLVFPPPADGDHSMLVDGIGRVAGGEVAEVEFIEGVLHRPAPAAPGDQGTAEETVQSQRDGLTEALHRPSLLLVGHQVAGFHLSVSDHLGALAGRPDRAGYLTSEQRPFGALSGVGDWSRTWEGVSCRSGAGRGKSVRANRVQRSGPGT